MAGRNSVQRGGPPLLALEAHRRSQIRRFRARFEELIAHGARESPCELTQVQIKYGNSLWRPCGTGWQTGDLLHATVVLASN